MAMFEYQALTADGRLMRGSVEAASGDQARQMLTEMRLSVQSVAHAPAAAARTKVGRAELLLFNQQLASITRANIPLDVGLRQIAADIDKPSMRKLVTELADDLQAGTSIEDAFAKRRAFFPPLYGHIVKAGIQSGRLSEMLTSLNRHLEVEGQTRRIIFEAMTYPLVVLAIAAVLLTAIFMGVVPPMAAILKDIGVALPVLTEIFITIADNVLLFWMIVGGAIAGMFVMILAMNASPGGRRVKESLYLHIPVLGKLYHRSLLSRLADSMALLVSAGCDLPATVRLASAATASQIFLDEGETLACQLENGANLAQAGMFCRHVPPLFFFSMQEGYQRNELQDNLYSLSEMYAQQVRTQQSRLQGILLPLMLMLVGSVVAMAVIAMFLPLISMVVGFSR